MADIDRDFPARDHTTRTDRTTYQTVGTGTGNSAGWWIAGLLVLAVLIIGFIAMSGGNPAPVEPAATTIDTPVAPPAGNTTPMVDPAPMTTTTPAPVETAPAAPTETTPAAPAPVEPAPAPAN